MGKSKLRGGKKAHNKRIQTRNLEKKRKEEKQRSEFMKQLQAIQAASMKENQVEADVVSVDDIGDIGDFDMDEQVDIETVEVDDTAVVEVGSEEK